MKKIFARLTNLTLGQALSIVGVSWLVLLALSIWAPFWLWLTGLAVFAVLMMVVWLNPDQRVQVGVTNGKLTVRRGNGREADPERPDEAV